MKEEEQRRNVGDNVSNENPALSSWSCDMRDVRGKKSTSACKIIEAELDTVKKMVENVEGTGLVQTGSSRGYSEEFTRVGGRELVRLGEIHVNIG